MPGRPAARLQRDRAGGGDDLDVDDIVQDTMVAVIRALPELRDTAKFRSWLVAIAVRQLTDARRRARSGRLTTLEHAEERHAPEPDFATLFLLRQSLTAEQRQVAARGSTRPTATCSPGRSGS
ncbi:RNA polymerase sigma factor [Streptomyces albidoflavus]